MSSPSSRFTAVLIVIDALGLDTLDYLLSRSSKKASLPNLVRLGLGELLPGRLGRVKPKGWALRVNQASASADSVVGHREMMGVVDPRTFDLFPDGFPKGYIRALEKAIGRKTLFNRMAGGMEAIELNAREHEKTGRPIVYASKCDPLIQLAMDEAVVPVAEQHAIADTAFRLALDMGVPVTRAIARAYFRSGGEFVRTINRHDAVLPLSGPTLVDVLYRKGVWTVAVGKTADLVNTAYHEKVKLSDPRLLDPALGLRFVHPKGKDANPYSIQGVVNAVVSAKALYRPAGTFVFANLVDTDSLYGHARDVDGALASVEETDRLVPAIESRLEPGDLLMVAADHGMRHGDDYGYHNKEPLPLLAERIGRRGLGGLKPGLAPGLAEAGSLLAQAFGCGREFLEALGKKAQVIARP
jgi:phosphopentomutase